VKPLAFWVIGLVIALGVFALVVNLVRETSRVLVVVDSSFPMTEVWDRVSGELDEIDDQRYSEFALATEKSLVHSWSQELRLGAVTPFAPCDFGEIAAYTEIANADDLILITTSASCPTKAFADWSVIFLDP
jgi:hypothetical protein